MKLHILEDSPNSEARNDVLPLLEEYFVEVRGILTELPEKLNIYLLNDMLIPETGEGGFAYSSDIVTVSFDLNFKDKALQKAALRGTVFHESYHLVQGHTSQSPTAEYRSALDSAIYEGCATVFEREYAKSYSPWGDYSQHTKDELERWVKELRRINIDDFAQDKDGIWRRWAFYDEQSGQRWRLYKVGTWLVELALARSRKDILELKNMSAGDIETFVASIRKTSS